jgi:hypothetical protein
VTLDNHAAQVTKNNPQVDSRLQQEYNAFLIGYSLQTVIIGNQNSLVDMAYFNEKKAAPKRDG